MAVEVLIDHLLYYKWSNWFEYDNCLKEVLNKVEWLVCKLHIKSHDKWNEYSWYIISKLVLWFMNK